MKRSQEYLLSGVGLSLLAVLMYVTRGNVSPASCASDRSLMACFVAHDPDWYEGVVNVHLFVVCGIAAIAVLCFVKATLLDIRKK